MARQKKDHKAFNIRMDAAIFDTFEKYAEDKGQTKTIAVERILKEHLEREGYKIQKNSGN